MAATLIDKSESKPDDISYIFDTMNYTSASDSDEIVKDWLSSHKNILGFFIDGKSQVLNKQQTIKIPQLSVKVPVNVIIQCEEDIENAINSSHSAFSVWSKLSGYTRAHYLNNIAKIIEDSVQLMTILESIEYEKPVYLVKEYGIPCLIQSLHYFAGWAALPDEMKRKQVGVVAVVMDKFVNPLMACWGIVPALAMGNSVLLIPDNMYCAGVLLFAEICAAAGLPPGVINVVPGDSNISNKVAANPKVNKILFHGYPDAIQNRIVNFKNDLSIDVSGRPTVIVFDTADIDSAVEGIIETVLCKDRKSNYGGVRVLVQESIQASVIDKIEKRSSKVRLGNCLDRTVDMCDIINTSTNSSIIKYLDDAKKYGAQIFQAPPSINNTKTIPLTVISNIQTATTIVSLPAVLEFTIPTWQTDKPFEEVNFNLDFGKKSNIKSEMFSKDQTSSTVQHSKLAVGHKYQLYYDGNQKKPAKQTYYAVLNKDKNIVAYLAEANASDVYNAIQSANSALCGWKSKSGQDRAHVMYNIAKNLELKSDEFSKLISEMTNESFEESTKEVQLAIQRLFNAAAQCLKHKGVVANTLFMGTVLQVAEPLGVIVIICPDINYQSFLSFISLISLAIAMGNTIVAIPSQSGSLSAIKMHQVFNNSEVPKGVINILTGDQHHLTHCLIEHRNIHSIWYHSNSAEGAAFVKHISATSNRPFWIGYHPKRDWNNKEQGQGKEFLYHCLKYKSIWLPVGNTFQ
ncbi:aldehyde dehydrogenase family 16 member A1-like isoform X3 [Centruroides sculpturatus]|uniref:aldehyde dehydrogenase family 16 member A1-like isoform X3 n=1 Tax=Centruroides sculpturatus TaxID=218467 RepID=UPI000C6EA159|nr:aldehyde dehydrogenase family 16 member A1-like isoform X3 [Centruroides sculpturatus]